MLARSDLSDPRSTWRERLLEVPEDLTRSAWYGQWAAFLLLATWGTAVVLGRMTDPPTLLHLTPFGEAPGVAGGTFGSC